ncbi:hypothetical protein H9Q09_14590 [Aurantimonas sp. DM33-3]|nr:hypothetical protein [Aurantimonas sp. DM33-3]
MPVEMIGIGGRRDAGRRRIGDLGGLAGFARKRLDGRRNLRLGMFAQPLGGVGAQKGELAFVGGLGRRRFLEPGKVRRLGVRL